MYTYDMTMTVNISTEQPTIVEEPYEITFSDLYHDLADIGDWHGLCLALNVDEATTDRLRNSDQRDEEKKRECLLAYHNSGEATWEGVIAAIAKYPLNNCRVANNIARKYTIASNPCQT